MANNLATTAIRGGTYEIDSMNANGTNISHPSVTFTPILTGTNGTRLVAHETGHFTVNADGVVTRRVR